MGRRKEIYKRKSQTRDFRKKMLIVTEGKTEKEYFDEYNRLPKLTVITYDASDNKRSLVEKAINHRDHLIETKNLDKEDRTWVVFDRDIDKSNPTDLDKFNQALDLAKHNNINVAYSNDSFELWFLIHFQDVSSALHRKDINIKLSGHLGEKYKKARGGEMYDLIKFSRIKAIKRAKTMKNNMAGVAISDANPSTSVHFLVEELMSNGFREKK